MNDLQIPNALNAALLDLDIEVPDPLINIISQYAVTIPDKPAYKVFTNNKIHPLRDLIRSSYSFAVQENKTKIMFDVGFYIFQLIKIYDENIYVRIQGNGDAHGIIGPKNYIRDIELLQDKKVIVRPDWTELIDVSVITLNNHFIYWDKQSSHILQLRSGDTIAISKNGKYIIIPPIKK